MDHEDRYLDLAQRVGDGTPIDWEEEGSAPDSQSQLLQSLRVIADVGKVHRDQADTGAPVDSERDPENIGNYRVHRRLGAGALGVVYEAEQRDPRRPVALKLIRGPHARDPDVTRLFQREARTLARLHHPYIAGIFESGCTDEGEHFIAMELVRGVTLSEWRSKRGATAAASRDELYIRLGLFRKICDAVAYAHQRGVIHRDLKPSNILVLEAHSSELVPHTKILDFGLAHAAFLSGVSELGRIRGTLPYMSPEQTRGNPDEIDCRTDIYSLGVILYELLADARPYDVDVGGLREKADVIRSKPHRPLAEVWAGQARSDRRLEAILRKALAKRPTERYQSIFAMIDDLDLFLARAQARRRARFSVLTSRPALATALVLLALYGALMTGLFLQRGSPRGPTPVGTPGEENR